MVSNEHQARRNKFIMLFAAAIILLAATYGIYHYANQAQTNIPPNQGQESSFTRPENPLSDNTSPEQPSTYGPGDFEEEQLGTSLQSDRVFSTVIDELPDENSPEMQAWKDKTYIPEPSEMDPYLLDMDLTELVSMAENGNVFAQIALGTRLVHKNLNEHDGIDWLIEAASHGSQEALRVLRWIYQFGAGPIEKDEYAFAAWSKVAYMLGDWQVMWPFGTGAIIEMGLRDSIIVDLMAANFFAEVNRRHFERTGVNMEIHLRPGYEGALNDFLNQGVE